MKLKAHVLCRIGAVSVAFSRYGVNCMRRYAYVDKLIICVLYYSLKMFSKTFFCIINITEEGKAYVSPDACIYCAPGSFALYEICLLYTSDAADEL